MDRPVCGECEGCRFVRSRDSVGYVAICTKQARRGRKIADQYGISYAFCRRELVDKIGSMASPKWCPRHSAAQMATQAPDPASNPLYASDGREGKQLKNHGQETEEETEDLKNGEPD